MDIVIQRTKEIHADAIARICSTGWKQTVEGMLSKAYQQKNVEYWYNLERVKKEIHNGFYSHVALLQSEVVGVIGGGKTDLYTGEIFVLYVDENIRYKGIGKKLLNALTQEQIKEGVFEQWISVQENNQRGIPFYEARGFLQARKKITETETKEKQVSLRYRRELD